MIVLHSLISILLAFLIYIALKKILWFLRAKQLTSNIPGPESWPIIGNAHLFYNIKTTTGMLDKILLILKKNGHHEERIVKCWFGPKLIIFISNPDHITTFLSQHDAAKKGSIYKLFSFASSGIFASNGEKWQELRRISNIFVTKKLIQSYVDVFNATSVKYGQVLEKFAASGKKVDIQDYTFNWTLDIITKTLFGYNLNELEEDKWNISKTVKKILEIMFKMMLQPPHSLSITYAMMSKEGRIYKDYITKCWNRLNEVFDIKRKEMKALEDSTSPPSCYADILLNKELQGKISKEETPKLAADFILAGSETTGNIINSVIMMLAMHPKHQDAVYKELVNLLGKDINNLPTWDDLNTKMPYTDRVIKETLRIFSPPIIEREALNDIILGNYTIPQQSEVCIVFRALHTDPAIWTNPHHFFPDHFLPEAVAKRPEGYYYPFSFGARSCPGNLYAMLEMKSLLSVLIRKFKFETDLKFEEIVFVCRLVVEIGNGYCVKIKPRF